MDADVNNPVVVLANWLTDAQAALVVAHLESLGISASISGSGGSSGWPAVPGYTQVIVRQSDLERARREVEAKLQEK